MTNQQASLPDFFEPLLSEQYSAEEVRRVLDGCAFRRPVTLRANTLISTKDEVASALDSANISWKPVTWYDDAFIISHAREDALRQLSIYQNGSVYLQSLSAMMPALVLGARSGDDILDMCAAPGGKTTQILALSSGKAYVTACEMHAPRAEKLEYNLNKLGAGNVVVMRTDARKLDDFFSFDRILLDAPCSGSGTLRMGDPKTFKRFTPKLIEKSVKTQHALMEKALRLLKPGGTLVYATCSILDRENEDVVTGALERTKRCGSYELKPVELAGAEGIDTLACRLQEALCICPTDLYEGFFIAKIERTA